jgi:hypothetical protein
MEQLRREINKLTKDIKISEMFIPRFIRRTAKLLNDKDYDWGIEMGEDDKYGEEGDSND